MSISCRLTELVYQVAESFLWVKITAVRHFHSPKFPSTLECQSAIWSLDRSASSRPSFRRWWHPQARKGCTWRTKSKSSNKFGANCIIHHHWLATKRILAGARQGLKKKCVKGTRLLNFWLCSFSSTAPTWQWIYGKWFQVTCWFPIFLSGRSGVVFMLAILNTAIMIMFMIHVMTCASSWKGKGKVCKQQKRVAFDHLRMLPLRSWYLWILRFRKGGVDTCWHAKPGKQFCTPLRSKVFGMALPNNPSIQAIHLLNLMATSHSKWG